MAEVRCPICGAEVDVRAFLALHRWPAAYPEDARAAVLPCGSGERIHVSAVLLGDNIPDRASS